MATRRIRYCCAVSLDGYIAGPGGEFDWIVDGPRHGLRRAVRAVQSLREEPGKDIWLFGGGSLFWSLAAEGFVDTVEVGVVPTILGGGVPLVAEPASRIGLTLREHRVYEKTGTVGLVYAVNRAGQR